MRNHVTVQYLALMLWLALTDCKAEILTPPAIPVQPTVKAVAKWGGDVVVITEEWRADAGQMRQSLGLVRDDAVYPLAFPELGCESYEDVAESDVTGLLLACSHGQSSAVYARKHGAWTRLPGTFPGEGFRMATDDGRIAVVGRGAAYIVADSRPIRRIALDIDKRLRLHTPSAVLLRGDTLLVAFNAGEFGGGLFRLNLAQANPRPQTVIVDNIRALAPDSSGAIWVAAGISHMILRSGALYRLSGGTVQAVATNFGTELEPPAVTKQTGLRFPGLTEVASVAAGDNHQIFVVLPRFGVFLVQRNGLRALFDTPLEFSYSMPGYIGTSTPTSIALASSGEVYIGTSSLGILVLRGGAQRYGLRQLLFQSARP